MRKVKLFSHLSSFSNSCISSRTLIVSLAPFIEATKGKQSVYEQKLIKCFASLIIQEQNLIKTFISGF